MVGDRIKREEVGEGKRCSLNIGYEDVWVQCSANRFFGKNSALKESTKWTDNTVARLCVPEILGAASTNLPILMKLQTSQEFLVSRSNLQDQTFPQLDWTGGETISIMGRLSSGSALRGSLTGMKTGHWTSQFVPHVDSC